VRTFGTYDYVIAGAGSAGGEMRVEDPRAWWTH